jgi:hypothetical protein
MDVARLALESAWRNTVPKKVKAPNKR